MRARGPFVYTTPMTDLDRIARKYRLEAIVLFGSRARGRARPDSDADVCVAGGTSRNGDFDLQGELSAALGANVDLVRFEHAGPTLKHHAVLGGRRLWGDPSVFRRMQLRAVKEWQDSREIDEALQAGLRRRA